MNTTLQELTDKLYAEGVEKGKEKASAIVAEAEQKAQDIIAAAEKDAAMKRDVAAKAAAELDKNTRSELKLFAGQAVNAVKTELTNIIADKITAEAVKAATTDPKFMQELITKLALQMVKDGKVVIEANDAQALRNYVAVSAKNALDNGIEIKEVKGIKTHFAIARKDGGFKLAFGDDELIAYFKEYLRPQLIELLF